VTSDITFDQRLAVDASSPLYTQLSAGAEGTWQALLRAHLDRWYERFHPSTLQHDALTLSVALRLPFVIVERATVRLDDRARMHLDAAGTAIWMSTLAKYDRFMSWLTRELFDDGPYQHG